MKSERPAAIAIAAHPDDIEFSMAGTLCLLRRAGYETHYLNVASGSCGSTRYKAAQLRRMRLREAKDAAAVLGATFHAGRVDDIEILYAVPLIRWLTGIMREVRPMVVLTHPPQDYMEDHTNTCRLVVTAAFARGMPNFRTTPVRRAWSGDVTVYHAMPHGLQDGLGRPVVPQLFVNTTSVQEEKLRALECHRSQQEWLQQTQGMNSYLRSMQDSARNMGRLSQKFDFAEGWCRHSSTGYCAEDADPLRDALTGDYLINSKFARGAR